MKLCIFKKFRLRGHSNALKTQKMLITLGGVSHHRNAGECIYFFVLISLATEKASYTHLT
jgi:hypothetical protein